VLSGCYSGVACSYLGCLLTSGSRTNALTSACLNRAMSIQREGGKQDSVGSWLKIRMVAESKLSNDRRLGKVVLFLGFERKGRGGDGRQGTRYKAPG
jgi:hypothetical protein